MRRVGSPVRPFALTRELRNTPEHEEDQRILQPSLARSPVDDGTPTSLPLLWWPRQLRGLQAGFSGALIEVCLNRVMSRPTLGCEALLLSLSCHGRQSDCLSRGHCGALRFSLAEPITMTTPFTLSAVAASAMIFIWPSPPACIVHTGVLRHP